MTSRILSLGCLLWAGIPLVAGEPTPTPTPPKTEVTKPAPVLSKKELETLRFDANSGDATAQYRLGMLYLKGESGVTKNRDEAVSWLRNAALQNHPRAAFELGKLIMATPGADGDQARRWLEMAAASDLPEAMTALGDLLYYSKDPAAAAEWHERAVKLGDITAHRQLGTLLMEGRGVKKDESRAFRLLKVAAEAGDAEAQFNVGIAYFHAKGVPKDEPLALSWFRKAAEQGHPGAQQSVGLAFLSGKLGCAKDREQGLRWLRKAAEQGQGDAKELVKHFDDFDEAGVRAAANKGDAQAQCQLAIWLFGCGIVAEPGEAKKWMRKSAELGHENARVGLGVLLAGGTGGFTKDDAEALKWLLLSRNADARVLCQIGEIYRRNEGVPPDEVAAYAYFSLALELVPKDGEEFKSCTEQCRVLKEKLGLRLPEAEARIKTLREELAAEKKARDEKAKTAVVSEKERP